MPTVHHLKRVLRSHASNDQLLLFCDLHGKRHANEGRRATASLTCLLSTRPLSEAQRLCVRLRGLRQERDALDLPRFPHPPRRGVRALLVAWLLVQGASLKGEHLARRRLAHLWARPLVHTRGIFLRGRFWHRRRRPFWYAVAPPDGRRFCARSACPHRPSADAGQHHPRGARPGGSSPDEPNSWTGPTGLGRRLAGHCVAGGGGGG